MILFTESAWPRNVHRHRSLQTHHKQCLGPVQKLNISQTRFHVKQHVNGFWQDLQSRGQNNIIPRVQNINFAAHDSKKYPIKVLSKLLGYRLLQYMAFTSFQALCSRSTMSLKFQLALLRSVMTFVRKKGWVYRCEKDFGIKTRMFLSWNVGLRPRKDVSLNFSAIPRHYSTISPLVKSI